MSSYTYDENVHYIDKITFNVFTNGVVKDYSSVINDTNGINLPESYENSEPKRGGLVDTRLGITDLNLECAYCGLRSKDCSGHFGHTELTDPVFHYGFFNVIKSICSVICLRSSKLLAHQKKNELDKIVRLYNGRKRFIEIKKLCSTIQISEVGIIVPKIKGDIKKNTGSITIIAETTINNYVNEEGDVEDKVVREVLNANDVYSIFRNISEEDWNIMGFNSNFYRPEDLILKTFPIPPVAIRPSLRADYLASATYEDDLTHKLADIIKTNEKLRKQKEKEFVSGEVSKYSIDLKNYLQYHVVTYFENDKEGFLTSEQKVGGKKFKSISERIKSKHGRIRGNLMGKRVNFSARSVITSDPNLRLYELGVPIKVAMEITFPEVVTAYNIDKLTKLVRNGRYKYPGANFVIQKNINNSNIREYDLRYRKKTIKLKYGDIVERHLVNGDPVLFNRQPSLHKLSMMCHTVHIINDHRYNTFRLNVNVTPPYNADFDGDEMNMFAPQSIQTQTELKLIAFVNNQIISPKDSKPVIGPVQDSVLGTYKLTSPDTKISWNDYMNLISYIRDIDISKLKINKNKTYTGKDLYNLIIPKNINLKKGKVEIKNGDLLKGKIDKSINKTIISHIWDRHTPFVTQNYIDNIQRVVTNWLVSDGFTVGLGDCFIDKKVKDEIYKHVEKKKLEISHLITEIENNPELMDSDIFEASIQSNLSAQKGDIEKIVMDSLDDSNNFFIMVNSKSKGGGVNLMQIMGVLGQDIFKTKRIQKDINNRTLPHFYQNNDTPLARGYIQNSYLSGLTPTEFFFHHMTGREGLIDTAIKTADTGYISRRLMKGLEDMKYEYDGTVRSGNNSIIQYIYGDSNLDQTKQKILDFKSLILGNEEINNKYGFSKSEIKELEKNNKNVKKINTQYINELIKLRDILRKSQRLINLNYLVVQSSFHIPINLERIILDEVSTLYPKDKTKICEPNYILEKINYILRPEVTQLICFSKKDLENKSLKFDDEKINKTLFKYALYECLNPKKIIFEYKLSKYKFDLIVDQIIHDFKKSQVNAGEMVGCLAAQHIGEPSTQMTLNTFHATGSGSSAMQGVPRVEELIRTTKNIKTPIMTIYLDKKNRHDREKANIIASKIQFTTIKDLIEEYQVIYDSDTNVDGYTKKDKVKHPYYVNLKTNTKDYSKLNWLIRIKLNKNSLIEKNVSILDIKTNYVKLWKKYIGELKGLKKNEKIIINSIIETCILSNFDNDDSPIIHMRFSLINYDYNLLLEISNWILNNLKLKGIDGISKIDALTEERLVSFDNEDETFVEKSEYVISILGINMIKIREIDGIDFNRTYCNEVNRILKYFGIEAARSILIKEFNTVYSAHSVNFHHISVLVDVMTNTGKLTSIDRHGINKLDTDPLSRASFEMPIDQLMKAAIFNEVDHIRSVSSRIMSGRVIKGGTGLSEILLDLDFIQNSEYIEDIDIIKRSSFIELKPNSIMDDIMNRSNIITFEPKMVSL